MSDRRSPDRPALVLAGHGSQRHARSAAPLHAHARRIRGTDTFPAVHTAFWKEEPTLRRVGETLERSTAVVVPVLTSEGYFADEVFPRELAIERPDDRPADVEFAYADPVGTHPALADVVVDRVEAARSGPPDAVGVAVVGHGTERNERSARSTEAHARRIAERADYAAVEPLFLDEAPYVADLADHVDAEEVVVVPLFVADGHHTTRDVPDAIGHPGIGETATVDGHTVHYTGAVGTEPSLAEVLVERAREACAARGWPVGDEGGSASSRDGAADGPAAGARTAFLDRLDDVDGATEWGDLLISRGGDAYELRHRRDADRPAATLSDLDDVSRLRARVRHDDHGRYRPLSGARDLPTGWRLAGLGGASLVTAVEVVYPGGVAHWHRERTGALEPTGFGATVDRQIGSHADLDAMEPAEREAAIEAVCGDCVRERRWSPAGGDAAEGGSTASGGDAIPCPEACPFLLTAAHTFQDADPAEASAPETDVPLWTVDRPGNRYRERYEAALAERLPTESVATDGGGD